MKFPTEVSKNLEYYVYLYLDPDTNEIFYIGKGRANRAFHHLNDDSDSEKSRRIREIRERGKVPKIEILIHGLESDTAKRVETAVIDLVNINKLTNAVRGWKSGVYGRMGVQEIIALYSEDEADIIEPSILIRINQLYRYGMSDIELYDITRGVWKVGDTKEQVEYAFAIYEGIIKEVYKVEKWFPAGTTFRTYNEKGIFPDRCEFVGNIAYEIREKYINKTVRHYFTKGSQNPIRYLNI